MKTEYIPINVKVCEKVPLENFVFSIARESKIQKNFFQTRFYSKSSENNKSLFQVAINSKPRKLHEILNENSPLIFRQPSLTHTGFTVKSGG